MSIGAYGGYVKLLTLAEVALEVVIVHRVESDDRGEQPEGTEYQCPAVAVTGVD